MISLKFGIEGLEEFKHKLSAALPQVRQACKVELYQFAEEVMAVSKQRVPVDTGALMNTGKVMPPVDVERGVTITLGYGDESAKYALFVHENLHPNVKWTRPGSGPKYLENPLKEKQDELPGRLGEAVVEALKKA